MRFSGSVAELASEAELNNWLLRIDIKRAEETSESPIGKFSHRE
jgi:hypothetical protein